MGEATIPPLQTFIGYLEDVSNFKDPVGLDAVAIGNFFAYQNYPGLCAGHESVSLSGLACACRPWVCSHASISSDLKKSLKIRKFWRIGPTLKNAQPETGKQTSLRSEWFTDLQGLRYLWLKGFL